MGTSNPAAEGTSDAQTGLGFEGSALMVFTSLEASTILMNDAMGVQMTSDQMLQQAMALLPGDEIDAAKALFETGKSEAAAGQKLGAAEVKTLIDLMQSQIKMQLDQVASMTGQTFDIGREEIVDAVAKAMKITADEVNTLYNGG